MNRVMEKLTTEEFHNIIDELITNCMDRMKIPGCDRNIDVETYNVGEGGDFICMIMFRGEVIASALLYRNGVISTTYVSENAIV